ncbi:hypothetical protein [Streptacidiphilus sp. EB129]|uniref:hypothetical protein n=1 Tax=Streptacidiphilus sp. EB129 TaxID=3156262 RepID=UPI0035122208
MHRIHTATTRAVTVGAATALLAVGAAVPAAVASSGGSAATITLRPSTVGDKSTVAITVDCTAYSTPVPTLVSSQAFSTSVELNPVPGQNGMFAAAATINNAIDPGDYTVTGSCQRSDERASAFQATLTVRGERGHPRPEPKGDDQSITGPVHTGVGGSNAGSPLQVALGGALVVGAGGVMLWRRRAQGGGGAG